MPHYCCAGECFNRSDTNKNVSFHNLPIDNKPLLRVWITKIKRNPTFFPVTKHTKICSDHFLESDFIEPDSKKRRLKKDAVPSIFHWTTHLRPNPSVQLQEPEPMRQYKTRAGCSDRSVVVEKLENSRLEMEEATDSASEGEGESMTGRPTLVSRKTETSWEDFHSGNHRDNREFQLPCSHGFTVEHLLSKCSTAKKEQNFFTHFCGSSSYEEFYNSLKFILPGCKRENIIYWGTQQARASKINTEKLFDNSESGAESEDGESESDEGGAEKRQGCTRPSTHQLSCKDEYFLLLMKLRTGASNLDLAERFNISNGTVANIILTWINYLYITLGSLKIWPHREILLKNQPDEFKSKYPNNLVIIDATELKIQVPSALQKHSECYSTYKSHTTFKSLIGVDAKGGILFVSQLYEGSISDKQLVTRSGFMELLKKKIEVGELREGDSIMADKGFNIEEELHSLGLKLNIPPFLKDKTGFDEDDVIKTQTVARHRIHVERAISKIRRYRIFHSVIPVTMFGSVNQLWTVACLLSNFQAPVLS